MSAGTAAYAVAIAVHVASALAGFGMVALSGLYASWARHPRSAEQWRDVRQFFGRRNRAGRALWLVPWSGGVALAVNHGFAALGQAWVIAAMGCWVIATLAATMVIWPVEGRLREVVTAAAPGSGGRPASGGAPASGGVPATGPPSGDERIHLAALSRPIVGAAALCDVAFTVALGLMILRPGR